MTDTNSTAGVYRITSRRSGRFYIGSSRNVFERVWQHRLKLRRGAHENLALQAEYAQTKGDGFWYEFVAMCVDTGAARAMEQELLTRHFGDPLCWNRSANVLMAFDDPTVRSRALATRRTRSGWNSMIDASRRMRMRPVTGTNINSGEVRQFESAAEAAKTLKLHGSSIKRVIDGILGQTGGWRWVYTS